MEFQGLGSRRVIATSNGGAITSPGGLLLRDTEGRVKLIAGFAACFEDGRDARRVEHELGALLRQRVYALALGDEDVNDLERLRFDPMLQILSGKLEATRRKGGPALAGKSTLNRLERLALFAYRGEAIDRLLVEGPSQGGRRVGSFWTSRGANGLSGGAAQWLLTVITATFRFTSSGPGISFCALGFGPPISLCASSGVVEELFQRILLPRFGHAGRSDPASGGFGLLARVDHGLVFEAQGVDYVFGLAKSLPGSGEGRAEAPTGAIIRARGRGRVYTNSGRFLTGRLHPGGGCGG